MSLDIEAGWYVVPSEPEYAYRIELDQNNTAWYMYSYNRDTTQICMLPHGPQQVPAHILDKLLRYELLLVEADTEKGLRTEAGL